MSERRPLRVLIVDDEPLGIRRLEELLEAQPDTEIAGVAEDGEEAVNAIRNLQPDLVLLDIQMPHRSGLDVVREVGPTRMPATIFVTAYDHHAVEAFELAALDYLVKPYDDERFVESLQRARRTLDLEGLSQLRQQMLLLLQAGQISPPTPAAPTPTNAYLQRIAVPMRGKLRVLPVDEIDYIRAAGVYVELYSGEQSYLIRESLQALEEQLDPGRFMRIHRSVIVRLDRVEMLLRGARGNYEVQLVGGARLGVGRMRREALEARLGRR